MLFQTWDFILFFLVIGSAYFLYPYRHRPMMLLFASYYFYMSWDWRFGSLILISTLIDFWACKAIEDHSAQSKRKFYLLLSIAVNLGILAIFKYLNFFIDSVSDLLGLFGIDTGLGPLHIILPVGISFFTFQSMSHTIDVYRREIPAERDFVRFALYVAFFPQLVAGPIVRASEFLPQLRRHIRFSSVRLYYGIEQFLMGLFKKVVIADNLSPVVDLVFSSPGDFSSSMIVLGVLCYAIQIFADFSGYSDMAIGIARIMGYKLPENFNLPYCSQTPSEFWRRWHISLSSWLRDYLYISLGGNRGGKFMTYRNLVLTMLLGGLWHGASYNFILWGAGHGLLLVAYRPFEKFLPKERGPLLKLSLILIMFFFTCMLWIPFRATTLGDTMLIVEKILFSWDSVGSGAQLIGIDFDLVYSILGFVVLAHFVGYQFERQLNRLTLIPTFRSCALAVTLFLIWGLHYRGVAPFVYFQF